jgi:probable F420-dependent oxidoreductase
MKVDQIMVGSLETASARALRAEHIGFDGIWTAESGHDAFLPLMLAAEHTENLSVGTSIAIAFARTPMSLAYSAWDLQVYSQGRFILGVGSQIKAHIERRFSMPWSHPAPRMREFIAAVRAIWASWQNGTKLDFRGDFYTHTLMPPNFSPGPSPYGPPKVFLAAVRPTMTEVAAAVADGMLIHGFTTERYIREVTVPVISEGLAKRSMTLDDFEFSYPAFVVTGSSQEEMDAAAVAVRARIAFYASTPGYREVLDLHGWGDLHVELNAMSKQDDWTEMSRMIDDEVLDTFAVRGEPGQVPAMLEERFGDMVDRVSLYMPYTAADEVVQSVVKGTQGLNR